MTFEEKDLIASELSFDNQTDEEYAKYIAFQNYRKKKAMKARQMFLLAAEHGMYNDSYSSTQDLDLFNSYFE